jgi:hypothetical protein
MITITAPGSYVLQGNVTVASGNGIVIQSENVTLDLNGFTISSTTVSPAEGTGILISANQTAATHKNVTIRNGFIRGGSTYSGGDTFSDVGFSEGIRVGYESSSVTDLNLRVSEVTVTDIYRDGISLLGPMSSARGVVVERCSAVTCGATGIRASTVLYSTAEQCGNIGINATIARQCTGNAVNTYGTGLIAAQAFDCFGTAFSTGANGLVANILASDCFGQSVLGDGLRAEIAVNCFGSTSSSSAYGMDVTGTATNCRGNNSGGVAIRAAIAVACTASSGTVSAPSKQLGTP